MERVPEFEGCGAAQKAIEWLRAEVNDECGSKLEARFRSAYYNGDVPGLFGDARNSCEYALFTHAHLDHGQGVGDEVPENFTFTTDEEVLAHLTEITLEVNDDGKAQERLDIVTYHFNEYRSWGGNLFFSYAAAVSRTNQEWNDANPPDEALVLSEIEAYDGDPEVKAVLKDKYTASRNEGKGIVESAEIAEEAAANKARELFFFHMFAALGAGNPFDIGGGENALLN